MHEELHALLPLLHAPRTERIANRTFHTGHIHGRPVVLVLSGIGKVAAAATAAVLLQEFKAAALVVTGVAGGLAAQVRVGDVVVARHLLQHDLDVSPLFARYVVPSSGRARFATATELTDGLAAAAGTCLAGLHARLGRALVAKLGLTGPARLHDGLVVSGDQFVSNRTQSAALRAALPEALAVEMEGAAVAQVCADFDCPMAVIRTISDRADDAAHVDFTAFIEEVASAYTHDIVDTWLRGAAPSNPLA